MATVWGWMGRSESGLRQDSAGESLLRRGKELGRTTTIFKSRAQINGVLSLRQASVSMPRSLYKFAGPAQVPAAHSLRQSQSCSSHPASCHVATPVGEYFRHSEVGKVLIIFSGFGLLDRLSLAVQPTRATANHGEGTAKTALAPVCLHSVQLFVSFRHKRKLLCPKPHRLHTLQHSRSLHRMRVSDMLQHELKLLYEGSANPWLLYIPEERLESKLLVSLNAEQLVGATGHIWKARERCCPTRRDDLLLYMTQSQQTEAVQGAHHQASLSTKFGFLGRVVA